MEKCQIKLGMLKEQMGGTFSCPRCKTQHTFLLKNYPAGSIFRCPCGFEVSIPFNENEIAAHISKDVEKTLKERLKKLKL